MNHLAVLVAIFGCLAISAVNGKNIGSDHIKDKDPEWCSGYAEYCQYLSIKTQCPSTCNITEVMDPSWCEYYKAFCPDNPSIRAQCPRTCSVAIDGGWGPWMKWGKCSVSCGNGVQKRARMCDHPKPENGGRQCVVKDGRAMMEEEIRDCKPNKCPIHGGYSKWSAYSICSKTCGGGIQYRNRCCTNPFPSNGGNDCAMLGSPVEARVCNPKPCPIHGGYSKWSKFGKCSKKCGGGTQVRTRTCTNPEPKFGGKNCSMLGPMKEEQACNEQPCPIDGGYTDWTPFSKCSVSCGSGLQYRSRCCINPMPKFGGKPCIITGEPVEVKVCNAQPCPIDGNWGEWTAFGVCTEKCGDDGVRMRSRKCDSPKPLFNGKDCPGPAYDSIPCNRVPCAVDGGFTNWTPWSKCSVSCGSGVRTSTRTCTNPAPVGAGKPCNGSTLMTETCNESPCPIDGNWGLWGAFSTCTASCGDAGVQMRRRECNKPPSMFGGKDCPGNSVESASCNRIACAVDGGVSEWGSFGTCSATCGVGIKSRSRTCTNPAPANGGKDCTDSLIHTESCEVVKCPEYKYGLDLATWDDAEQVCVNWGGHLASVHDQGEMNTIAAGFASLGVSLSSDVYVWIGLQDRVVTNKWMWIDGSITNDAFIKEKWGNGEPSHNDHHCVSMNINPAANSWWDRNCPTMYRYVCKK